MFFQQQQAAFRDDLPWLFKEFLPLLFDTPTVAVYDGNVYVVLSVEMLDFIVVHLPFECMRFHRIGFKRERRTVLRRQVAAVEVSTLVVERFLFLDRFAKPSRKNLPSLLLQEVNLACFLCHPDFIELLVYKHDVLIFP
jgi:hypothetical protein